jgi:protein involved in polysaccharide export with SLBB domain
LQSGDTVFVPVAAHQVLLEGAFARVALSTGPEEGRPEGEKKESENFASDALERDRLRYRERLEREVKALEERLHPKPKAAEVTGDPGTEARVPGASGLPKPVPPPELTPTERQVAEDRLITLQKTLDDLRPALPGEQRVPLDPRTKEPIWVRATDERPEWLRRWEDTGQAPAMQFEVRPGESVATLASFAGGLLPEAGNGTLALRRRSPEGVLDGQTVSMASAGSIFLQRGDTLSALPRREATGKVVTLAGWARVPGPYARIEGLTVGALLRREQAVLPDTYQARGEILRTFPDAHTQILPFDVARALAGDAAHDVRLEDRDRIELFRLKDLRMLHTVRVSGPLTRPGLFPWHVGMRAADLIFRGGVPKKSANRLVAELARSRDGQPSEIRTLDLEKLLSTEAQSPVALLDESLNPTLRPDDQVNLYEKPEFKVHRVVRLSGQVARPGEYVLDGTVVTLRQVLARAGGITGEAMPQAGIFLRKLEKADSSLARAAEESGLSGQDPTAKGINEILQRLNETKRQPTSGQLLASPILHGLATGSLNRLVVNFTAALSGDAAADVELQDGDEIIVPRQTQAAYVVGETASPFGAYQVGSGTKVRNLLRWAGGTTRNADTGNIRLLKADGRILDTWVTSRVVEPGDTLLVPQRIRRDTTWQENLNALTPIALILNAVK